MGIWTVLSRTEPGDTAEAMAGRTVFVREKFSWATLFFAPFVLARFRLWLPLAAYVAVVVVLQLTAHFAGVAQAVTDVVMAGFHLLLAFELPALRQRKLARQGYEEAGVVIAPNRDEAEQRFFADWAGTRPAPLARADLPAIRPMATPAFPGGQSGVIGAFPGT
ncbi:DUF2628 domain-containing protein [Xanthobacter oligotrophicus]|uniref:DUF2628 domain-containing protein n=1 Tax=Xanthobacter oligotrophicus TaxID=2607286 RepID=UPI0011F36395|nr:DUF2628 domain-containing protein [Xanthobacter oligotrophicus]MCG5234731.1 DUF2628 domain-containing protein [Xanthobacter oligotrophicus]